MYVSVVLSCVLSCVRDKHVLLTAVWLAGSREYVLILYPWPFWRLNCVTAPTLPTILHARGVEYSFDVIH
eukprot:6488686-Amphidinium_carterae.1